MRSVRWWFVAAAVTGFVADQAGLPEIVAAPPSVSQLETLYRQIDARRNLSLAEKYEAKLQVHKASLEAGQAYLDALENLQKYSAIAGEAGEILRPETAAVLTKFSERLEKAADNPVFKQFGNVVKAEGYAAEAVKLVSELDEIGRDSNLPPSARRSLQALRGAAEALSHAGDVPLAGPVLETYGACLKELTQAVRTTAKQVTELKGGGFSLTEQMELLAGLSDGEYRRTALFEQGLPVVEETIREQGQERVYLQVEPGRWTEVSARLTYPQLVALVQDFRILHDGRNPTPQEIVHYIARPDDRRNLAERALFEAEFRLTQALRDDIAPDMNFRRFDDAQDRLRERIAALGLPIGFDSSAFRTLLQQELKQAGSYNAELRRMALNLTPYAREYLRYRGVTDPDAVRLDDLAKFLQDYRDADVDQFAAWLATQGTTKIATTTGGNTSTPPPAEQPQPKDAQTEKLERRAKELAEKGLKPRDPAAPVDPNEAKPIIPEDGTIEIVTWRTEAPHESMTASYHIHAGLVTAELPDYVEPAREWISGKDGRGKNDELRASQRFQGTVTATNRITGTWAWKGSYDSRFWHKGVLDPHLRDVRSWTAKWTIELNVDGTVDWSLDGVFESRVEVLAGKSAKPRHDTSPSTFSGVGVWQIRKSEPNAATSRAE
ncbi:MAG: hypothetical protein JNL96_17635 [Planctomycetaceae bacterium]|nr:hypothetical protein [Planctomycetaceae bacterium]